jgi:hypothetical protein
MLVLGLIFQYHFLAIKVPLRLLLLNIVTFVHLELVLGTLYLVGRGSLRLF